AGPSPNRDRAGAIYSRRGSECGRASGGSLMPAAIRDVELSVPLSAIEAPDHCDSCLLVLRWRGRVVGRSLVGLKEGRLTPGEVEQHARAALGPDAVRAWLEDVLEYDGRKAPDAPLPSATVAICTRERPIDLERTLLAVSALDPAPIE